MEDKENQLNSVSGTDDPAAAETAASAAPETARAEAEDAPGVPSGEKPPKISARLKKALLRCGVALIVIIALLAATRFSVFGIIKGAKETSSLASETEGSFVKRDIYAIVGCSDTEKSGETVVGEYAVVPMDGKFAVVHLPRRFLSTADTVQEETKSYIDGSITTLDKYFVVDGTVTKLSDDQQKKLSDWFTANKDYLVQTHVIDESGDASTYLSDALLEVDRINGMSEIMVIVLSGIAGALLVYVIVELILMACGFYLDDRRKAQLAKAEAVFGGETTDTILAMVEENGPVAVPGETDNSAPAEPAGTQTADKPAAPSDETKPEDE